MNRLKFGFLAAIAILSASILTSCQNNTSDKSAEIAKLEKTVTENNKQCPYYLTEDLTLECFELKDNNLVFCYIVSEYLWVEFEIIMPMIQDMDEDMRSALIDEMIPDFIAYSQVDDGFVERMRMCVAADYGIAVKYRPESGDGFTMLLATPKELKQIINVLDK